MVTDDEIRSLAISQRLLGTKEIILIHHTDCGMLTFTDDEFKRRDIQDETGLKPEWAAEAFPDVEEDVRQSIAPHRGQPVRHQARIAARLRLRRRHRQAQRGQLLSAGLPRECLRDTCGTSCLRTLSCRPTARLVPYGQCVVQSAASPADLTRNR